MARAPGSDAFDDVVGRTLAAGVGLVAIPSFGALSDRVGRRPVYLFGALFSLVYSIPFFWLLDTRSNQSSGRPSCWVWCWGTTRCTVRRRRISELFGAGVRYSGASLAYQLASVAAGGLAPFIATALLAAWGVNAVAGCMMLLAGITVAATYAAPETHREALRR